LWRTIERRLGDLLTRFYRAGALLGDNPSAGFTVRCDRTTMTQNDLDNGRVLARVEFAPAHPVGRITVVLSLRDGVSLNPEPVG
jgi:phage tail sheath protein FI